MNKNYCLSEEDLYEVAMLRSEGYISKEKEAHLKECPDCKKKLDEISKFEEKVQGLKELGPEIKPEEPKVLEKIEKYTLVEKLGQGGMGQVYKAYDPDLERYVAIKVLRSELSQDSDYRQRFVKEARAVAKLSHQSIIQIYSSDYLNQNLYMVMEYLSGADLTHSLNLEADDPKWIDIFSQILQGIKYAHEKGFLHRDLKPSNIMITNEGHVKLLDFGLVTSNQEQNDMTVSGTIIGTVSYMAPEIAKGERATEQSDIYSLGVVFYQLLTKKLPFYSETPLGMIEKIKTEMIPEPIKINRDIPNYLNAIIMKMCAKTRSSRYQSVSEILDDLAKEEIPHFEDEKKAKSISQDQLKSIIALAENIQNEKPEKLSEESVIQIAKELDLSESSVRQALKDHQASDTKNSSGKKEKSTLFLRLCSKSSFKQVVDSFKEMDPDKTPMVKIVKSSKTEDDNEIKEIGWLDILYYGCIGFVVISILKEIF